MSNEIRLIPFAPVPFKLEMKARAEVMPGVLKIDFMIRKYESVPAFLAVKSDLHLGGRADELWRKSCLEFFWSGGEGPDDPYYEFNLSPDLKWNCYRFHRYRERDLSFNPASLPRVGVTREGDKIIFSAQVELPPHGRVRFLGVNAVIEREGGSLSYWAVHHPDCEPNFHDKRGFVAHLESATP